MLRLGAGLGTCQANITVIPPSSTPGICRLSSAWKTCRRKVGRLDDNKIYLCQHNHGSSEFEDGYCDLPVSMDGNLEVQFVFNESWT